VKLATRRYRAKKAESALSGHKQGLKNARGCPAMEDVSDTRPVIPSNVIPSVIPSVIPIRPEGVSDNQWEYMKYKAEQG
jgi:hypothetical protein